MANVVVKPALFGSTPPFKPRKRGGRGRHRDLRARSEDQLTHASCRPDFACAQRRGLGSVRGWPSHRDPFRRRRLLPLSKASLARRLGRHRNVTCLLVCDIRNDRRQECGVDETRERRALSRRPAHCGLTDCVCWNARCWLADTGRASSRARPTAQGRDPVLTNVSCMAAQLDRQVSGNEFRGLVGRTRPIAVIRVAEMDAGQPTFKM